jgi:hypothetical protein
MLRSWETDDGEVQIASIHAFEQIMEMEESFR